MKRLFMIICCIFLLAGPALGDTIAALALEGGNGTSIATWTGNNNRWNTIPDSIWPLGVSSSPGGPLLNSTVDTSIPALPFGTYYLYAEPNPPGLGNNPILDIYFSSNPLVPVQTLFTVAGDNGSGTSWTRVEGYPDVLLGWASGTADLVGPGYLGSNGVNDYYLTVTVGPTTAVPLPGAAWLLGTGLLGLAVCRRRKPSVRQ